MDFASTKYDVADAFAAKEGGGRLVDHRPYSAC